MKHLDAQIELWLTSERRNMSQDGQPTEYLIEKQDMLETQGYETDSWMNTGAAKAKSQADQAEMLLREAENLALPPKDICKKLGVAAAKSLKVVSGFAMRAGYFMPPRPEDRYQAEMLDLVDPNGLPIPTLTRGVSELQDFTNRAQSPHELLELSADGRSLLHGTNVALHELYNDHADNEGFFEGSEAAYAEAKLIIFGAQSVYVSIAKASLALQESGFDNKGPIILEPRSDGEAHLFLRIESLKITEDGALISEDMVARA